MIRTWLGYVQPANVMSWPVFVVTLAWVLVGTVVSGVSAAPSTAGLLVLITVLHAFLFCVLWLAIAVLHRLRIDGLALSTALLGAIVGVCALRGAVVALSPWWPRLDSQSALTSRAVGSAVVLCILLTVSTIATGELRGSLKASRRLQGQQGRLVRLRAEADEQVRLINEELVVTIRAQLLARLRPLESADASTALAVMRSTIDDVVRPISHWLAGMAPPWIQPEVTPEPYRIDVRRTMLDAADPSFVRPVPITAFVVLAVASSLVVVAGPARAGLALLTLVIGSWGTLSWVRWGCGRVTAARPPIVRALVFLGTLTLFGLALYPAVQLVLTTLGVPDGRDPIVPSALEQFRYAAPVYVMFVGYVVALHQASRAQSSRLEAELTAVDRDLRWELARARERLRQRRHALASALHGRVQSALTAAFLRVELERSTEPPDPELIGEVRAQIESSIAQLSEEPGSPDALDDVIALVRANWAGIAEITLNCSPQARRALDDDPSCLQTINDLLPELCFNAIKHASADRIDVGLSLEEERLVLVAVRNNGSPPAGASDRGLGHQLLEHSCLWWRRDHRDGITTTYACVPCSTAGTQPALAPHPVV